MEKEVLITASEYLIRLEQGIEKIAYNMETGNEIEACSLIADATEGIQWILDVVRLTENIHKGNLCTKELEEFLYEIVEALENDDFILVGDLFNYEILPQIIKLKDGMIKELGELKL